jgi:hypothetical protein
VDVSFLRGDLVGAEEHFVRWSGLLGADGFKPVPGAAVVVIGTAGLCAGALGSRRFSPRSGDGHLSA